ncbi:MAG TPA: hypothetical protein PK990_06070 [Salinivirgaceae bacterium]|nr:hypothetical protein [Salinivirgaceae bacterium]
MTKRILGFLLLFLSLTMVELNAQEFDPRKDFIYGEDYFRPYSPYLVVNGGYGFNFNTQKPEQNLAVDYHFRWKFEYLHFNLGYFSSTERFLEGAKFKIYRSPQRSQEFHVGLGTRYSVLKHNIGGYGGISLVAGRQKMNDDMFITRLGPGVYAQLHYHWKPVYDLGIGTALYLSVSEHWQVLGLQVSFLFSGDYKPPAPPKVY